MLNKIIDQAVLQMDVDVPTATRLVHFIDVLKMKGFTGGEAASRFADQLGFLRIPDNRVSHEFFAVRWTDHKVWITVTDDLKQYLNNSTPLFTQSRLEPVYRDIPFYEAGLERVDPGVNRNVRNRGTVRNCPRPSEQYSNFIIHENLPDSFFLEVPNTSVQATLENGLPPIDISANAEPRKVYVTVHEARSNLAKDLISKGLPATQANLVQFTLLALNVDKMEMNNDVFWTKTLSGHKGQGSNYGYFYTGAVPADGCSIAHHNLTK